MVARAHASSFTPFFRWLAAGTLALLAACGGGGGDSGGGGAPQQASATVGAAGGSVAEPGGAQVSIPAGALAAATAIGVESNAGGAPALPSGVTAAGPIVAFTPHGITFAQPVAITVPFDPSAVPAGRSPVLYKTNAAGAWEQVTGATVSGSTMTGSVSGFSWAVVAPAPLPSLPLAWEDWSFTYGYTGAEPHQDRNEFLPASHNAGLPLDLEFAPYHGTLEGAVAVQPFSWPDYWFGAVHATADGRTFWAQAVAPTTGELGKPDQRIALATDLTVTRVMRKLSDTATDKAVFTEAVMELVDGNPHDPFGYECPWWTAYEPEDRCKHTMQGYIQITVDAWATLPNGGYLTLRHAKAHVQFFGWRRQQYLEADTYAESDVPVWNKFDFKVMVDDTNDKNYPLQWAGRSLIAPAAVTIPLDTVATGAEYTVQVKIHTAAYNRRQAESFVGVTARDPAGLGPGVQFESAGVEVVREPAPRPVPVPPPVPVRDPVPACGTGPDPAAGVVEFDSASASGFEGGIDNTVVVVRRSGGAQGATSVLVTSADGSAHAGTDYLPVSTLVRFEDGEQGTRAVPVAVVDNGVADGDRTVSLSLSRPGGCAALGAQATTTLTIHDNDTPLPPTSFNVSGTVSGLLGTGLVLVDRFDTTHPVTPTGDGSVLLRSGVVDRTGYEIAVQTQPVNPAQNCTVANGSGTVNGADVTNVAITCTTVAASGSLDQSFGTGGKLNNALPAARALAVQPDGRLLALGGLKLSRYNVDGSADTGFGSAGVVTIVASGGPVDEMRALALQPDGRIVVAGWTSLPTQSNDNLVVLRFNADGSPDTSFGRNGQVIVDFAGLADRAYAVLVQPDGRIVAAGIATLGTLASADQDMALVRLNDDGSLDAGFGSGGKLTANVAGKADFGYALARQADGKLVVAGRVAADGGSNPDMGLLRVNADGSIDTAFGSNGRVRVDFGGAVWDEAADLAVQGDGALVVGGFTQAAGVYRYALARLTAGGQPDSTFGTLGLVSTPFSGSGDFGRALLLQADGRLVVAGQVAGNGANPDFGIARYGSTGALDPTFGAGGLLQVDFYGGADAAFDVVQMPDGRLVSGCSARNGRTTGLGLVRLMQ
ncbi:MAG: Calx-beta domain-containing protein [Rubrivivax sp.]